MAKSYGQLVPSVERRLATWLSLSGKRAALDASSGRPSITLSRRFGCEAYPLAEQLKALLDEATGETWNIYDKALLERVSRDEHLSMTLLENLGGRSRAADSISFLFSDRVRHDSAFRQVARHLVQLAEAGNAILVGRGGAILTQKLPNCFHFRLDASLEYRVASLARRLDVPEKEAEHLVRESDATRERFIEDCLGASLSDLSYYDAVFNNARHDVAAIARAIVSYVAQQWPDRKYFRRTLAGAH